MLFAVYVCAAEALVISAYNNIAHMMVFIETDGPMYTTVIYQIPTQNVLQSVTEQS